MKSIVSEKGQVTIPKQIRDRLGIRPGQTIEWDDGDGRLIGIKSHADTDGLDALVGVSDLQMTSAEFMEWVRGPREDLDN